MKYGEVQFKMVNVGVRDIGLKSKLVFKRIDRHSLRNETTVGVYFWNNTMD